MEYRFADWKAYDEFMEAHKKDLKEGDRITIDKPIMPGASPVTTFEVVIGVGGFVAYATALATGHDFAETPEKKPADYKWVVPDHDHDSETN